MNPFCFLLVDTSEHDFRDHQGPHSGDEIGVDEVNAQLPVQLGCLAVSCTLHKRGLETVRLGLF